MQVEILPPLNMGRTFTAKPLSHKFISLIPNSYKAQYFVIDDKKTEISHTTQINSLFYFCKTTAIP